MRKYAILHSELCDNYSKCPSMLICRDEASNSGRDPAITFDVDKIIVNKDNCIGCTHCVDKCGLFRIVSGIYQERMVRQEFESDPRNRYDKTVERFGCDIIDSSVYALRTIEEIKKYIDDTIGDKVNILEFVVDDSVFCPIQGIDVNLVLRKISQIGEYRKCVICASDVQDVQKVELYKTITKLKGDPIFPSIVIIKNGAIPCDPIEGEYKVVKESSREKEEQRLFENFDNRIKKIGENNG